MHLIRRGSVAVASQSVPGGKAGRAYAVGDSLGIAISSVTYIFMTPGTHNLDIFSHHVPLCPEIGIGSAHDCEIEKALTPSV